MGSVWQALAYGFLGQDHAERRSSSIRGWRRRWEELELRLCFRGANLRVEVGTEIDVSADRPMRVSISGAEPVTVDANGYRVARR